jgi:hypothetical protein
MQQGDLDDDNKWDNYSTVPESIGEGEVWIRQHPASKLSSGFQEFGVHNPAQPSVVHPPKSKYPPYYPFSSLHDFNQARILIKYGASDGQITEQLQHNACMAGAHMQGPSSLQSAKDLHKLHASAIPAENLKVCLQAFSS